MKNRLKQLLAICLGCVLPGLALSQSSTALTYQGRLDNAGTSASGYFDLRFGLFGVASGGTPVANVIAKPPMLITNGFFTTTIDFGAAAFPGDSRWIEVAVRPTGSSGDYQVLAPRQRVTAAPYAIQALGVADRAIGAGELSATPGQEGDVLKLSAGQLAWGPVANAGVTTVTSGLGLVGGPITNTGILAIDTNVVPRLDAANAFTNIGNAFVGNFSGSGAALTGLNGANLQDASVNSNKFDVATRALLGAAGAGFNVTQSNRYNGVFIGNGAGITNLSATLTNTLAGDVTGPGGATVVARIRGANVASATPAANQLLRYNGTAWTPGGVALGTDVSGTLALANGGTAATTATAARANLGAAASGANTDITALSGLTSPLSANQGGSGQSSYTVGDLLYANTTTSLAKLPDVASGSALVSGGVGVAPLWGKIGLSTHVSGTLPLANGGTAASTASAARANLGAAASGTNSDISALTGLTTPLSVAQGGNGLGSYSLGDLLYASGPNTMARRAIGTNTQVLSVRGGLPVWTNANDHLHYGQVWTGSAATDGLYVQNNSTADGASGMAGIVTAGAALNYGLFGQSASTLGVGVQGLTLAATGFTVGVNGQANSVDGTGVYGLVAANSGTGSGVIGESRSPNGTGVFGQALATNGTPVGVYGYTAAVTGYGLYTPNRLYVGNNAFVGGHLTLGAGSRIQADAGSTNTPAITFFNNQTSGLFSPATNVIGFVTSGAQRLRVAADGKVGIGRIATTNRLELEGEASKTTAGGWLANSDAAIKRDVHSLKAALNKIEEVRPVGFRYTPEYLAAHPEVEDKVYYNVIAQEFMRAFPGSVKSSGEILNGRELLQVDTYPALIFTIAAVQELHEMVSARDRELAALREANRKMEARLAVIERALLAEAEK